MVRLTVTIRRRLLQGAIAGLVLLAAWPIGILLSPPAPLATPRGTTEAAHAVEAEASPDDASAASQSIEAYAAIYARDLRRPLVDPEPPVKPPPPKPKLGLTLEGTVIEPGNNYAFVRTRADGTRIVSEGQTVQDAEVVSIESGRIVVRFHDELITLTIPEDM